MLDILYVLKLGLNWSLCKVTHLHTYMRNAYRQINLG